MKDSDFQYIQAEIDRLEVSHQRLSNLAFRIETHEKRWWKPRNNSGTIFLAMNRIRDAIKELKRVKVS